MGGLLVEPAERVNEDFAGGGVCNDREGERGPEFDLRGGQINAGDLVKSLTQYLAHLDVIKGTAGR